MSGPVANGAATAPHGLNNLASLKTSLMTPPSGAGTPNRPHTPAVANNAGYTEPVFEGKAEQANQVKAMLRERGFLPPDLSDSEVDWFYQNLGISDTYFALENPKTICDHILALYGDRKSTRLNSSHSGESRMPSSA